MRLFFDAEDLLCDMLELFLRENALDAEVLTSLPVDYEQLLEQHPVVVLQRVGGAVTANTAADNALLEIGVVAATRRQAWNLMGQIRAWLLSDDILLAAFPQVAAVEETSGPVQPVWANPEYRWVKHLFSFTIHRKRG